MIATIAIAGAAGAVYVVRRRRAANAIDPHTIPPAGAGITGIGLPGGPPLPARTDWDPTGGTWFTPAPIPSPAPDPAPVGGGGGHHPPPPADTPIVIDDPGWTGGHRNG